MQPFFFGNPDEQLLGVYHPPLGDPARDVGVVLCYPTGHECLGALRAFRVLANRLARAGFHTLRFDYYATGDSAGDSSEADLGRWLSDVNAAVEELRASHGVPSVSLLGLRLGATLAALVAAQRSDIESLVLWEPVIEGQLYLQELRAHHQDWLTSERNERPKAESYDSGHEVLGYPLTGTMARSLERIRLLDSHVPAAKRVLIVEEDPAALATQLATRLTSVGAAVAHHHSTDVSVWKKNVEFPEAHVPTRTIGVILEWLSGDAV